MTSEIVFQPDIVLLGPGGSRAILEIGTLKRLFEEEGFTNKVKTWAGVSAGAGIALLIVCGYTPIEIEEICSGVTILDDVLSINLDEAAKNLGLVKLKGIEAKLSQVVSAKFGFIPTLKQLYVLTGLELSVVAFNVDKMEPAFLEKNTAPDLSCVESVMMSISIPILFQPRKYNGDTYIDGAVGACYPLSHYDNGENFVLGMYISSDEEYINLENNPMKYIYRLIHCSMKVLRDMEIKYASDKVKHIILKTSFTDTTGLTMDQQTRNNLLRAGYIAADNFLKINKNPEKYSFSLEESQEIPF